MRRERRGTRADWPHVVVQAAVAVGTRVGETGQARGLERAARQAQPTGVRRRAWPSGNATGDPSGRVVRRDARGRGPANRRHERGRRRTTERADRSRGRRRGGGCRGRTPPARASGRAAGPRRSRGPRTPCLGSAPLGSGTVLVGRQCGVVGATASSTTTRVRSTRIRIRVSLASPSCRARKNDGNARRACARSSARSATARALPDAISSAVADGDGAQSDSEESPKPRPGGADSTDSMTSPRRLEPVFERWREGPTVLRDRGRDTGAEDWARPSEEDRAQRVHTVAPLGEWSLRSD